MQTCVILSWLAEYCPINVFVTVLTKFVTVLTAIFWHILTTLYFIIA